jgi:SNF2 family DNA or RNA helicase
MLKLSDLSHFSPKGKYQAVGIHYLLQNPYCILGDDMGLGKSFQLIAAILKLQQPAAINVPAYLRKTWKKELEKILKRDEDHKLFHITSYSKSKDYLEILRSTGVKIAGFDEAHYLKNIKAQRTDNILGALEEERMDRIILMSGTPIKNRIPEWYTLLTIIHYHLGTDFLDRFPNEWVFSEFFCKKKTFRLKKGHGRQITTYYGVRNRDELLSYIRPIMLRRLAVNVLDLVVPEHIYVDADISTIHDKDLKEAFETGKDTKAKRLSALSKVKFTANYIKDVLETGDKMVMFTCHPEVALQIKEKLKHYKLEVIIGDTPVDKRQEIVDRLQDPDPEKALDGLLCSLGAASSGYTMTAANHYIANDESYVVGDNAQGWARVNRIGQEKPVLIHHIGGSKTDSNIAKSLVSKAKDLDRGM